MKKPLVLLLIGLFSHSSYSQKIDFKSKEKSQPITTEGISLPQLITTNINRSNLQFGVNLTQGLKNPSLSINFEKFKSDNKKQLTIVGGALLDQSLSFEKGDRIDFYTINSSTLNLGVDMKLFNKSNYFLQLGTMNSINKARGIVDFENIITNNSLTIGIGKGRIDYANDGAVAIAIIERLSDYGILQRDLDREEYTLLVQKIATLKNRRRFANRSYPLTEPEEIQDLLSTIGVIDSEIDFTAIIDEAYKYEPLIDRTTGSQFLISLTGSYFHSNTFSTLNNTGIYSSISYMIHSPINSKWQYNKGASLYIYARESELDDLVSPENNLRKAGIGIHNELHCLIDNRSRIGITSTAGYNFKNQLLTYNNFEPTYINDKGLYINLKTELEYRVSRTIACTYGITLNISPQATFTGINFGVKF